MGDGGQPLSQYSRTLGRIIEEAPVPDSQPYLEDMGVDNASDKRVLDRWEPQEFQRILRRRSEFAFDEDKEGEPDDMNKICENVREKVIELIADWDPQPLGHEKDALCVVALYVMEDRVWNTQNDMVATLLLGTIFGRFLRAHSDAVVMYHQGAYVEIEEIGASDMRRIEVALLTAALLFKEIMPAVVAKEVVAVFQHVKRHAQGNTSRLPPITSIDTKGFLRTAHDEFSAWAMDAFKSMSWIAARFVGRTSSAALVGMAGQWLQVPRPDQRSTVVVFEDACINISPDHGPERLTNVKKSIDHESYFFIPCKIVARAPDWAVDKLRMFLSTGFAKAEAGWKLELSLEALAFMNQVMPPVLVLEYADGGNSKSARTLLRNNVWQGHHKVISPRCFQEPEEFRKQGGQFASAKVITIQECAPGEPMVEEVMKKFISGERLMCRPLFGTTTAYYRWSQTAKFWECNWGFPSISGSPEDMRKLYAFERRLRVLKLHATFTSDPTKVDIEQGIFLEDTELAEFLESPFARQAYIETYLLPWIMEHSAQDCRDAVMDPPSEIRDETRRVVATMANGGIHVPESFQTAEEHAVSHDNAEKTCRLVHADQSAVSMIKTYDVKKIKCIPGCYRQGKKGDPDRLQVFTEAVSKWPHLFILREGRGGGFERLDVNLAKMEEGIDEAGGSEVFGGGFFSWLSTWECKEILRDREGGGDLEDASEIVPRNQCGSLMEVFNYVKLAEKVDAGLAADPDYARQVMQKSTRCGGDMAQIQAVMADQSHDAMGFKRFCFSTYGHCAC